jgi:hypothetical protein
MNYYVYENWQAKNKAVVHVGPCGYCNEGEGCHRTLRLGKNGKWSGPFRTLKDAEAYATNTRRPVKIHRCVKLGT